LNEIETINDRTWFFLIAVVFYDPRDQHFSFFGVFLFFEISLDVVENF